MGSAHPRLGASSPQLWQAGLRSLGSPTPWLPRAPLPSPTWSHPPLLTPVLHPSPSSFGTLRDRLSPLRLLCARPGFGTSCVSHASPLPSALAGCWHPPWHPSTPGTQHPRCAAACGSAWASPEETRREGMGCLGKQALALAGHPGKIKTSGQAAAQRVREAGTP